VRSLLVALGIGIVLAGGAVSAHHSFAAFYFEDQSVTIEGQVVEYQYRNPHTWLHFTAKDAQGETRTYAAEWSSPGRLRAQGVTQDTLKAGDQVIVTGSPGRTPSEYRLHLKGIQRPADNWTWAQGNGGDRRRRR
jgi:exonuclease VII large subunit